MELNFYLMLTIMGSGIMKKYRIIDRNDDCVLLETIGSPKQYKVLQGMKVKYIQGFYFDKPMPGALFELKYCPGIEH